MSRRITAWLLCLLLCVLPVFAGNVPEPEEAGSPSPAWEAGAGMGRNSSDAVGTPR